MNVATIAGLLRERAQLRTHDGWTREEVLADQARRLDDLRAFAIERSPFYRDVHRGLERAPLADLPVVTKATLMERFDDLVTDRDVHLADVEAFSATASATDRFRGHYRTLGRLPVAAWQVVDEGDRLRLLLAGAATVDASVTADSVQRALEAVGVRGIQVAVSLVDSIPRSASGKAPPIRRAQLATAGH